MALANEQQQNPVLQQLSCEMRCGLLTSSKGEITVLHDRPLHNVVAWAEFDEQDSSFSIIYEQGEAQKLGLAVDARTRKNLECAQKITLIYMKDGKTVFSQNVGFVYKD